MAEIAPKTLKVLAEKMLPYRYGNISQQAKDTSGGAYFLKDNHNRIIIGTADRKIHRYALTGEKVTNFADSWSDQHPIDLKPYLSLACQQPGWERSSKCSKIIGLMYDNDGNLWFETNDGYIGYVLRPFTSDEKVISYKLADAMTKGGITLTQTKNDKNIINIVGDHALYSITNENKQVKILWKRYYYAASQEQPGGIGKGSDTSPTIFGERHQYVAISDRGNNAHNKGLTHVKVYAVDTGKAICDIPIFQELPYRNVVNNSFIGYKNSLIILNSYGANPARSFLVGNIQPGLIRVDIQAEGGCHIVWKNYQVYATATPEMSSADGLIYSYDYKRQASSWQKRKAWWLDEINYRTGEIVKSIYVGRDKLINGKNNRWGIVTLMPHHTLYVGMAKGFLQITAKNDDTTKHHL